MKQKYLLLKAIDVTSLQLAQIRSWLADLVYIEIDNVFFVSCNKSFKEVLSNNLNLENINYVLVYVNIKAGSDFFANGVNENDCNIIRKIVTDN